MPYVIACDPLEKHGSPRRASDAGWGSRRRSFASPEDRRASRVGKPSQDWEMVYSNIDVHKVILYYTML